jgi:hypothetical protein
MRFSKIQSWSLFHKIEAIVATKLHTQIITSLLLEGAAWHQSWVKFENTSIFFSDHDSFSRKVEVFLRDTDIQERQGQQRTGLSYRWLYYLQFQSVLNCWFIELCTTTWRIWNLLINMENRSTATNLFEYDSFVLNSIEEGWQVDSVYMDFSKILIEYAINCF